MKKIIAAIIKERFGKKPPMPLGWCGQALRTLNNAPQKPAVKKAPKRRGK